MNPNMDVTSDAWRQSKFFPYTDNRLPSYRASVATVNVGQLRQWATISRHQETPAAGCARERVAGTPQPESEDRKGPQVPRSAPSLANIGLEKFQIGALHEVIKGDSVQGSDDFFPGGPDMPESFRGDERANFGLPRRTSHVTLLSKL